MLTNVWVSEKIHSNPSFSHPNIWGWGSGYFRLHFSLQPILSVVDMISTGKDDMAKYSQSENSDLYIHIYIYVYIYISMIYRCVLVLMARQTYGVDGNQGKSREIC